MALLSDEDEPPFPRHDILFRSGKPVLLVLPKVFLYLNTNTGRQVQMRFNLYEWQTSLLG